MKVFFLSILSVLAFSPLFSHVAHAGTSDNVSGWAWSSNIGWISFNCTNDNSCGTANYGVNKNADDTLTGYAWSSNIGWIQFGGLAGFPTGSGTQGVNAQINGNNLKGWARALSYGSGWDGWISLSGAGPSYGISLSGTSFIGYAWGSDVVGWVSFDIAGALGVNIATDATLDATVGGSSVSGSANVAYASNASIVWTISNLASGATCTVSKTSAGGTAFASVTGITASGSTSTGSLTQGSYTYQIQCVNGATTLVTKTVSFTVLPLPAGFSITGPSSLRIPFLAQPGADSESGTYFVDNGGTSFANPVTVSVTSP
ncbi:hypothetical protein KW799_01895, partial [Candidatus Parcubacteria bacterium]|nr:hypothetical protein [Candidatus Parcubacteria bacterium]